MVSSHVQAVCLGQALLPLDVFFVMQGQDLDRLSCPAGPQALLLTKLTVAMATTKDYTGQHIQLTVEGGGSYSFDKLPLIFLEAPSNFFYTLHRVTLKEGSGFEMKSSTHKGQLR